VRCRFAQKLEHFPYLRFEIYRVRFVPWFHCYAPKSWEEGGEAKGRSCPTRHLRAANNGSAVRQGWREGGKEGCWAVVLNRGRMAVSGGRETDDRGVLGSNLLSVKFFGGVSFCSVQLLLIFCVWGSNTLEPQWCWSEVKVGSKLCFGEKNTITQFLLLLML
jgi:hypothetical protein